MFRRLATSIAIVLLLVPIHAALASGPVTLVREGRPEATIVVADEPRPVPLWMKGKQLTVAYAAEELQRWVEKASGACLPIVPASKAPATGTLVLVGQSPLSDKFGLRTPLRPEGLRIAAFERGLAILGEVAAARDSYVEVEMDRGTLFGVYEFLERTVGYRFYAHVKNDPEIGTVTPVAKNIVVRAGYSFELAPDFLLRTGGFSLWENWPAWMRVVRHGAGGRFAGANHTDTGWPNLYPCPKHPEMYALRKDGTRDERWPCYSSPQTLEGRLKMVQAQCDGPKHVAIENPWVAGPRYIPFEPADLWDYERCYCARCQAAYRDERGRFGKNSDLLFGHGVALAAEARKRWPDKRVIMLAYEGHMLPPSFEIPDNLDIQLCMMWSSTVGKEDYWQQRNLELIRSWSQKLGGRRERLYVWNYYCWPSQWTAGPIFFPHALQKWLQETYPISGGEFINPGSNPLQYELFMCWIWHKLLWDRQADVDALLHDYATKFFGPAAAPMEAFYRTIIDRYENVKWSQRLSVTYLPPELVYRETYTPDVVARLKNLMADALAACPADERDLYRRRVLWLQEGFAPFFKEADLAHKWLRHAPMHRVPAVAAAPRGVQDWQGVPAAVLVQGNYGETPDLTTSVAMVRHGGDLYVRIVAQEPDPQVDEDALLATLKAGGKQLTLTVGAKGATARAGDRELTAPVLVGSEHKEGCWRVEVKLPLAELGFEPDKPGTLAAQFQRHRAARSGAKAKDKGTDYFWMPPMKPPWGEQFRFGQLHFERRNDR
jgi:hypothetical protein